MPWDTYVAVTKALGDFRLKHGYDQGTLRMRGIIPNVPWKTYRNFLAALGDFHVRHTFSNGTLEIMSPLKSHDWIKRIISRMIETMAYELRIRIQSIGSTTIYRDGVQKGFEADEAYYIAHEPVVGDRDEYDPDSDPPPDLVLEVDVTSSSTGKLSTFAALRVPEIWRHDGETLVFFRLARGKTSYRETATSVSFPFLRPEDIMQFVARRNELREDGVVRAFVRWSKKLKKIHDKQDK
jgi:Uma2 family endonuclease